MERDRWEAAQLRVADEELPELEGRLTRLRSFLKSKTFTQLDSTDQALLVDQEAAMTLVVEVLQKRIAHWESK